MTFAAIAGGVEVVLHAAAAVRGPAFHRPDQVGDRQIRSGSLLIRRAGAGQAFAYDVRLGQAAAPRLAFELTDQSFGQADGQGFHVEGVIRN